MSLWVAVYVGMNLKSISELIDGTRTFKPIEIIATIIAFIMLVFLVWWVQRLSNKELLSILEENEEKDEEAKDEGVMVNSE